MAVGAASLGLLIGRAGGDLDLQSRKADEIEQLRRHGYGQPMPYSGQAPAVPGQMPMVPAYTAPGVHVYSGAGGVPIIIYQQPAPTVITVPAPRPSVIQVPEAAPAPAPGPAPVPPASPAPSRGSYRPEMADVARASGVPGAGNVPISVQTLAFIPAGQMPEAIRAYMQTWQGNVVMTPNGGLTFIIEGR